ncbi:MAG: hypothetical protein KKF74_03180 [Nanoarchaeota archaeon]|nr:hypothetical protein [Nanoarchaeota archaeon]
MKTKLEKALDEIQEEELRKKNKKKFNIKKEKKLQYYSNWNKNNKEATETKQDKQAKLKNFSS